MKVVLQAGHLNIAKNSDIALRPATGAPGEVEFTADIVSRLKPVLVSLGLNVTTTDANANDDKSITSKDWDLFLAIHWDADVYKDSGGFVDFPEPSTDFATAKSQSMANNLASMYFPVTGIKNVPARSNKNTRYYYMWQYLSAKTPCVLIECGVGNRKPDDYNMLNLNRAKVLEGISKGLARAFGIPYTVTDLANQVKDLQEKLDTATKAVKDYQSAIESDKGVILSLNKQINDLKVLLDSIGKVMKNYNA
jgi:hypothetical protein